MLKRWLMYGLTALICGVLAQQVTTTVYLAKIDNGLHTSLQSTKDLAAIQTSIIAKNQALLGMAQTAKDMDAKLNHTLQVTLDVDRNIHTIDQLNQSTLDVNQTLTTVGQGSQKNLAAIATQLQQLTSAVQTLHRQLGSLNDITALDESTLRDMKAQTDTMNAKTPGVK